MERIYIMKRLLGLLAIFGLMQTVATANDPRNLPADTPTEMEADASYQWTALHWAARHGQTEQVRTLLEQGDLEARDLQGRTPLHIAVLSGHEAVVDVLIEAGADVNARDNWGIPPLKRIELIREYLGWDRENIAAALRAAGGEDTQIWPL
jgi:ankyrin repeat protein